MLELSDLKHPFDPVNQSFDNLSQTLCHRKRLTSRVELKPKERKDSLKSNHHTPIRDSNIRTTESDYDRLTLNYLSK